MKWPILLVSLPLFFSCSSKNVEEIGPNSNTAKPRIEDQLIGKWISFDLYGYPLGNDYWEFYTDSNKLLFSCVINGAKYYGEVTITAEDIILFDQNSTKYSLSLGRSINKYENGAVNIVLADMPDFVPIGSYQLEDKLLSYTTEENAK